MYKPDKKYGQPNLGKNVQIVGGANFGSEPYLIKIGDNTTVSFDCAFVTHDAATRVIRNLPDGNKETVIYAPITRTVAGANFAIYFVTRLAIWAKVISLAFLAILFWVKALFTSAD